MITPQTTKPLADSITIKKPNKPLLAFVLFIGLAVGIGIVMRIRLEPMVKSALVSWVAESTDGVFELELSKVRIHLFRGGVSMDDVRLTSDSTRIAVKRIEVSRIHAIRFWRTRTLEIGSIRLETPSIDHTPAPPDSHRDSLPPPMRRLYESIRPSMSAIRIRTFHVSHGSVSIRTRVDGDIHGRLDSLDLTVRDVNVDSTATLPTEFDVRIASASWTLDSALYRIQSGRIDVSASDHRITVTDLRWVPLAGYEAFAMIHRKHNRVAFAVKRVDLSGWESERFIRGDGFFAERLSMSSPSLEVAHDKRLPPKPFRVRKLMHLLVNDLPMTLGIDRIDIADGLIVYRHHHHDHDIPAVLRFDGLVASLDHVGNHGTNPMLMHVETRVMGEGKLVVDARFEPDSPTGRHTVKGRFEKASFASFNPVLEHLIFTEATGGYLNRMDFEMTLDDRKSSGFVTMDYEGVTIRLIGDRKRIRTFIANRFVINTNHTGRDVEPSAIRYVRLREKNIFHYWWMSLLSGMKPVLGM